MSKVLLSFLLSLVPVWFLGAVFLTSPTVCHLDDALGLPVPVAGTSKQTRDENWNRFSYGKLGLEESDSQRAFINEPKTLIFGDSYIEADMVKPNERVQAYLSKMGIPAVGIGISGNSCVEYHHLMGIYNGMLPEVTTNIILIADISDILPPNETADFYEQRPEYPFRKVEGRLGEISYSFRLMAFRNVLKKAKTAWCKGLDWRGNQWYVRKNAIGFKEEADTSHYEQYWQGMLDALKSQAPEGRLMIVYAPIVPYIQKNAISTVNGDADVIQRFSKVCQDYGLIGGGIIDVTPRLCEYVSRTRRFPRGFFNTKPGTGHLNGEGHRIVAEAIRETLAL